MKVKKFTFNPIQENMYVVYDNSHECLIIDPGCYFQHEREELKSFIAEQGLNPVKLLNTHCHLDHMCGNAYVAREWNLKLEANLLDAYNLDRSIEAGLMYNMPVEPSPEIQVDLKEGDKIRFGNNELKVLFTPGHTTGGISFYSDHHMILISGDLIFRESVGRTDLPGGDYDTLIETIRSKVFTLPENAVIMSGHGENTTVGYEKAHNPFFH